MVTKKEHEEAWKKCIRGELRLDELRKINEAYRRQQAVRISNELKLNKLGYANWKN